MTYYAPGLTSDDVNNGFLQKFRDISGNVLATIDDMFQNMMGQKTSFVTNAILTVSSLVSTYPPSSTNVGMYARVSDLYGSVDDIMRCRFDGINYRWVPQREGFAGTSAATGGGVSLIPLVTPPTIRLTGTLSLNMTLSPSSTNAYIGQRFRVVNNTSAGALLVTVTGLIGSNITIANGGSKDIEYAASGWFAAI